MKRTSDSPRSLVGISGVLGSSLRWHGVDVGSLWPLRAEGGGTETARIARGRG
jgi:hypothetical protein